MKIRLFSRLALLATVIFFAMPGVTSAVGVTPSLTTVDHFANGISTERIIYLTRASTDEPSLFRVSMNGQGAKYIEPKSNSLEFGPEEKQVPFTFTLKPETAPAGEYVVTFTFESLPTDTGATEGTVISIGVGAVAEVHFTIVDEQIEEFQVLDIGIDPAEEDQPVVFQYQLRNTGNVDARPFRVAFFLTDQTDPTHVISEEFTGDDIAFVPAAQTQSFVFRLKSEVPQGKYFVKIQFFDKNGGLIYQKDTMSLVVFPPGTLAQSATFEDVSMNGDTFEPNELIKFDFRIKNDGDLIIKPVGYIELKTEAGEILDLLRAEEKTIPRAQVAAYTLTTRLPDKGLYTADIYFDYGIKRSETKTLAFRVAPKTIFSDLTPVHYGGAVGLLVVVGGGLFLGLSRRKKKYVASETPAFTSLTTSHLLGEEPPTSSKSPKV